MIRGEIWWVDLGIPLGSEPGYKRPVIIIQDNSFNKSHIQTVLVASLTTNIDLSEAPGNVFIEKEDSGLSKDSVINISQISTIDKNRLVNKVSQVPLDIIRSIESGLKLILGIV